MLVVAEDREERKGGGEDPGLWGCLISTGPSDDFDRAQAPIRQSD